jgi:hypothetical protein
LPFSINTTPIAIGPGFPLHAPSNNNMQLIIS